MVKFFSIRRPEQKPVYVVSVDRPGNKAVLDARPELIRNAIAYWIDSDKPNRYLIGGDTMEARVSETGNLHFAQGVLSVTTTLVDERVKGTYPEVVIGKVQKKDAGSLVGITVNFPQEVKDAAFGDKNYNADELASALLEWLLDNQERVTLGYGPEHPLDNIAPLSVSDDYIAKDDRNIVQNFGDWLREIVADTAMTSNEHAFYVDENNNSIGVIAGGRSSVRYPSSMPGATSVSAHTHPTIKSIAFPSETDLKTNAHRASDDAVEMVICANAHTNLIYEGEREMDEVPNNATAEYPFTEAPVMVVKRERALTEGEIERHHENQADKIRKMLDQQLDLKDQGLNEVEPQLSEPAFSLLQSEFDKSLILRDKLIDDNKAIEGLNEVGKENSLKYTLEQYPLPL